MGIGEVVPVPWSPTIWIETFCHAPPQPRRDRFAPEPVAANVAERAVTGCNSLAIRGVNVAPNGAVPVAAAAWGVGVSGKSRGARVLGRALRMPSVLDRQGTRWMLQALSPAPVIVLVHRGRKSGRVFKTPVELMLDDRERGEFVIAPMWGKTSDWYRNVVAGGLVEVHARGETLHVEWRELDEAERREAMDAYRKAHPIYSRIILRMLVRVNGFEGDLEQAVLRELPMLRLHRAGS